MALNMNVVKMDINAPINDAEFEKSAIEAEKKMQTYHDRKEKGQLTEQEKRGIANNQKIVDYLNETGKSIIDLTKAELQSIIEG